MTLVRSAVVLMGLAVMVGCVLVNQWVFSRWLGTSYVAWYVANGPVIGLISSVVALSWGDLDRNVGLISAHPVHYLGSYLQLIGLPIFEIGTHMRSDSAPAGSRSGFDLLLSSAFMFVIALGLLAWVWIVVPIQYPVYLVCGAPGRVFARSERRVIARLDDQSQMKVEVISRGTEVPKGWWEASIGSKPVTAAGIFAALLLALLGKVLERLDIAVATNEVAFILP